MKHCSADIFPNVDNVPFCHVVLGILVQALGILLPLDPHIICNRHYYLFTRLGKPMMEHIRSLSTLWRATCSFPKYNVDYRDYLRASFHHLDVMTFSGYAACRTVQYIDIRGTNGTNITAPFWQNDEFSLHTDSQFAKCGFTTPDAVHSEDNFGHYVIANPKFRCTETIRSTTQYWFGGNV